MDSIRILHVIPAFGGGISTFVRNLITVPNSDNMIMDVAGFGEFPVEYVEAIAKAGGKVYSFANPHKSPIKFLTQYRDLLKSNEYIMLHCHFSGWKGLIFKSIAKIDGVKLIATHAHRTNDETKKCYQRLSIYISRLTSTALTQIVFTCSDLAAEFICFDYYVCDGQEKKLNERQYLRPGLNSVKTIYQEILSGKFNNLWCNLYARDAIISNKVRFKSEIKMGEDAIFNIEFLKNIRNCYYYKYPLYIYNNNSSGSAMHQYRIEYLKDYTVLFDYYKLIHEILPEAQLDLGAKHYLNKMFGCLFYTNDNIDETQYLDLVHSWFYKIVMEYPYYDVKNIFKKKFIEREYFKKKLFKTLIRVMIKE